MKRSSPNKYPLPLEASNVTYYKKERGIPLTVFVLLLIAYNVLGVIMLCAQSPDSLEALFNIDPQLNERTQSAIFTSSLLCAGLMQVIFVIGAIAIWNWEKWGIFITVLTLILNILSGMVLDQPLYVFISLVFLGGMYLVIPPKYDQFFWNTRYNE